MEPIYIGVDFHSRQQTLCYLKTETGELVLKELRKPIRILRLWRRLASSLDSRAGDFLGPRASRAQTRRRRAVRRS